MKKYSVLFLLLFIFMPFIVNAETCNDSKISIKSISMESKSDNVEELEPAKASGRSINLNIKMDQVKDNIVYKIIIKNDSNNNFTIDDNIFKLDSNYVSYTIKSKDNSNIVKAKSSKEASLRIEYSNKIPSNKFSNGKYNDSNAMVINLTTGSIKNILTNPNTGNKILLLLIFLIFVIALSYTIVVKKENSKIMMLMIGLLIVIPVTIYAACKIEININSKIQIVNKGYMPCTFDGDMVQGAEFVYGDFIYRYKQEANRTHTSGFNWVYYLEWININEDGWGVRHKDTDSNVEGELTPKMCSSINGKPIVSMAYTFYGMRKINKMNLSYIDTSNVVNMEGTFMYTSQLSPENENHIRKTELVGLENWEVNKAKSMKHMFLGTAQDSNSVYVTDMSGWNTSNVENFESMFFEFGEGDYNDDSYDEFVVTGYENFSLKSAKDISYMFSYFGTNVKNVVVDVSKYNLYNLDSIEGVFEGFGRNSKTVKVIGLDKWDVSRIKNMGDLFLCFGQYSETVDIGNISKWNVSNVEYMYSMFNQFASYSKSANAGDLSNWDVSKVKNMNWMFGYFGEESEKVYIGDISNWNTLNVEDMQNMFEYYGTKADNVNINVSRWNFLKVTRIDGMFDHFASESTTPINIGKIDVYSNSIESMFKGAKSIKVVLNIYTNPSYGRFSNNYDSRALFDSALIDGSQITINYSNNTTNIDDIIATKSENSHVVKGSLLD